jgi:hypothetical protein
MAVGAGALGQLVKDGITEVQSGGTVRVPDITGGRASTAALAAVADEEGEAGRYAVDRDNDSLSTVGTNVSNELCMVHCHEIVRVELVKR